MLQRLKRRIYWRVVWFNDATNGKALPLQRWMWRNGWSD